MLLGDGAGLFVEIGGNQIRMERTRLIEGHISTSLRFRVLI